MTGECALARSGYSRQQDDGPVWNSSVFSLRKLASVARGRIMADRRPTTTRWVAGRGREHQSAADDTRLSAPGIRKPAKRPMLPASTWDRAPCRSRRSCRCRSSGSAGRRRCMTNRRTSKWYFMVVLHANSSAVVRSTEVPRRIPITDKRPRMTNLPVSAAFPWWN